ncbi:MAG: hypothetical protein HYY59_04880 [Candidatus Omnitrophica bacterium]|nr:hypothetical protein [Candidatus Omnitrophota bacterium]
MNTEKDEGTFADFMDAEPKASTGWKWVEGVVDTDDDHIKIWHGKPPTADKGGAIRQSGRLVALVAPGPGKSFIVQFLLKARPADKRAAEILKDVRRELDFYLIELSTPGRPAPWAYAQYHCDTAANIYSKVHWGWYPKGPKRLTEPHSARVIRQGRRKFVFRPARQSS